METLMDDAQTVWVWAGTCVGATCARRCHQMPGGMLFLGFVAFVPFIARWNVQGEPLGALEGAPAPWGGGMWDQSAL